MKKSNTFKLVLSGLFVAIGLILPNLVHSFGNNGGSIFLPMHLPVLLAGLICGALYGGVTGFLIILLSTLLTGRPPIYPVGIYMALELITYGVVTGLLYKKFNVFISLIGGMIVGRISLGVVQFIIYAFDSKIKFNISAFLISAFVTALPGIVIQLALIPVIVKLIERGRGNYSYEK